MDEKQANNKGTVWVPTEREIRVTILFMWFLDIFVVIVTAVLLPAALWFIVPVAVWIGIGTQRHLQRTMREPDEDV